MSSLLFSFSSFQFLLIFVYSKVHFTFCINLPFTIYTVEPFSDSLVLKIFSHCFIILTTSKTSLCHGSNLFWLINESSESRQYLSDIVNINNPFLY